MLATEDTLILPKIERVLSQAGPGIRINKLNILHIRADANQIQAIIQIQACC